MIEGIEPAQFQVPPPVHHERSAAGEQGLAGIVRGFFIERKMSLFEITSPVAVKERGFIEREELTTDGEHVALIEMSRQVVQGLLVQLDVVVHRHHDRGTGPSDGIIVGFLKTEIARGFLQPHAGKLLGQHVQAAVAAAIVHDHHFVPVPRIEIDRRQNGGQAFPQQGLAVPVGDDEGDVRFHPRRKTGIGNQGGPRKCSMSRATSFSPFKGTLSLTVSSRVFFISSSQRPE